ncbi:Centromere protein Cenp-O [Moelleriella libera RCEF 2490]|uniref:Centromere protein Cenp-O n=1 Tax=Moelleriella libera RCEF 2490 TaxID=1081109 RepID=A0A166NYS3_9HYPO|nr:Centromere protein Cenp-O [Moelleriella libera RCEF 2490]
MAEQNAAASEAAQLDKEIAALRKQAFALRKALQVQCSTILSSASTARLIRAAPSPSGAAAAAAAAKRGSSSSTKRLSSESASKLRAHAAQHQAYMQQCSYRISAPVTSFKVRDPDPNAVGGGHVLGLRFEIMSRGQFLRPYYVMLNRPYPGSRCVRVHRHTVPPAVPLAGLAARYLPPPSSSSSSSSSSAASAAAAAQRRRRGAEEEQDAATSRQDLDRFVRTLRREIVRYHNRLGVSADLRKRLGIDDRTSSSSRRSLTSPNALVDVGIADIEAKQINLTWADDRTGRLVMDDDGKVVKLVVFSANGRDWETAGEIFTENDNIEDVARKLEEHVEAAAAAAPEYD